MIDHDGEMVCDVCKVRTCHLTLAKPEAGRPNDECQQCYWTRVLDVGGLKARLEAVSAQCVEAERLRSVCLADNYRLSGEARVSAEREAALREEIADLKELLGTALGIVNDHAPGHTVWLAECLAALGNHDPHKAGT